MGFKRNSPDTMALGLSLTDVANVQHVFERNAEHIFTGLRVPDFQAMLMRGREQTLPIIMNERTIMLQTYFLLHASISLVHPSTCRA